MFMLRKSRALMAVVLLVSLTLSFVGVFADWLAFQVHAMRDTSWRFRTILALPRRLAEARSGLSLHDVYQDAKLIAVCNKTLDLGIWKWGDIWSMGWEGIYNGCTRTWNMHEI
jgi:hypothetical protein